jgi:hypothetical protein
MLQGVQGAFSSNNDTNGVFINYNSGTTWNITASSGKKGWVNCVQ